MIKFFSNLIDKMFNRCGNDMFHDWKYVSMSSSRITEIFQCSKCGATGRRLTKMY